MRADSPRSIRRRKADTLLALAVFLAGCFSPKLVTLSPISSEGLTVGGAPAKLTSADVERAKQITEEIAAHFGFTPDSPSDADGETELFDSRHGSLLAHYSFAGVTSRPTYLSLQLLDDHSHLIVAIHDLSYTDDRAEIVRLLQADFERMFEEAFPHYEVKAK